jgi:hypothetical protein
MEYLTQKKKKRKKEKKRKLTFVKENVLLNL